MNKNQEAKSSMEIVNDVPPVYERIIAAGMRPPPEAVFTYGNKLYNPSEAHLTEDVLAHEAEHMRQQGDDPETWWANYLTDKYFRIREEAAAYGKQYAHYCRETKDRERRNKMLIFIGQSLASQMYGGVIDTESARRMVRQAANVPK